MSDAQKALDQAEADNPNAEEAYNAADQAQKDAQVDLETKTDNVDKAQSDVDSLTDEVSSHKDAEESLNKAVTDAEEKESAAQNDYDAADKAATAAEKIAENITETVKKEAISDELKSRGIDLEKLKEEQHMEDVDDFDFISHVAYDQKPLTRKERAENVKKRDFLHRYGGVAREVLEALLDKYMDYGITEIESTEILKLDPFRQYGKPSKIAKEFGGKDKYFEAIRELEKELYMVG